MIRILITALILLSVVNITNGQGSDSLNKYDLNNLKTGKWVGHWTETRKVAKVEYYLAGKKNGLCTYYNMDGRLQNEIEYLNDSISGLFKFYSPTGQREVAEFKGGKREGITRYYDFEGNLTEEYEYHNNMRNGFHHVYSETGRVVVESTYVNGRENGTRRSYKDNSKRELILETDFINDVRIERRYYENGKIVKIVKDDPSIPQKIIEG